MTKKEKEFLVGIADVASSIIMHMMEHEITAEEFSEWDAYYQRKAIIEAVITDTLIELQTDKACRRTGKKWRSLIPIIKQREEEFAQARREGKI